MSIRCLFKKGAKSCFSFFVFMCLLFGQIAFAQQTPLSGVVLDETGQAMPGVNIVEKGTKNSASTDFDGKFSIKLSSNKSTIIVSYIGYQDQSVNVAGKSNVKISLVSQSQNLQEVVVVGYGKVKKTDLTGSVGTLSAAAITERNLTGPMEAMQGAVSGVQISNSTGRLGDSFNITIRGKNSMNPDSKPLYVVDGAPSDNIDFLNPQDIARIDILKDASSTAIYGSRGSNGVVIVTTKSGSTVKSSMSVTYDSFVGQKDIARLPKMMDGQKWWQYHLAAYYSSSANTAAAVLAGALAGGNTLLATRIANNETFDWYDAVLKSGIQQNHYVNVSGRTDGGVSYNLGLGLQKETGNIEKEALDKYSFKLGLNHKVNDKFSIGANITLARIEQEQGSSIAMQEAFRLSPFYTPYALDGSLTLLPAKLTDATGAFIVNKTSTVNPLLEIANSSNATKTWNGVSSVFAEFKPLSWLTLKTNYSVALNSSKQGQSWGALTQTGVSTGNLPSAKIDQNERFNYTWDNQFNIDYAVKDHTFSFLGLQSINSARYETLSASSAYMPFDTGIYNLGSGKQTSFNLGSSYEKNTLASFATRFNYGYKGRYLLTISNRWDGSSRFAEGKKWGSFPSGAFAWRISEEGFMKNQKLFSDLKLRTSFGYTGNNIIPSYSTINKVDLQTYYDFNGTTANGWLQSSPTNSNLGWEKTREMNLGFDFGFANDRITGTVDVYDRLSSDLLLKQKLVIENGFSTYINNIGSVSNRGVELALTTKNIKTDLVSWETSFVFTKNTNKIKSIYDETSNDVGNNLFIGESIDAIYNYKFNGIVRAGETYLDGALKEGNAKVEDHNGDGKITTADRYIIGNSNPDWTGSISTRLKVGNFDLSASAIISQGVTVFSPFHKNFTDLTDRGRQKLDINWYMPANTAGLPENTIYNYPQPRNEGAYWNNDGVGYYRDASFVKVKNISLGYSFTQNILDKLKLKGLRVYGNVLNPFVFTKYDGYDPEWAGAGLGIGRVASITYQLGLSIKL
jgi:TonB-linked SusC/RagA family outer membrane protein